MPDTDSLSPLKAYKTLGGPTAPTTASRGAIGEVRVAFDMIAKLDSQASQLRGRLIGFMPEPVEDDRDFDEADPGVESPTLVSLERAARYCQRRLASIISKLDEIDAALRS